MRERSRSCRAAASTARRFGALSSAMFKKRSSLSVLDTVRFALRARYALRVSSISIGSPSLSLDFGMVSEDRTLVTVLCLDSIGLLAAGIDAVASLALDVSSSSSPSMSIRCRSAIGVGSPECCRWGWFGVVAGAFLRA
jgi:hypothetical protein